MPLSWAVPGFYEEHEASNALAALKIRSICPFSKRTEVEVKDKEAEGDLAQRGVTLVFAHLTQSLKADLDRQGLTAVIRPNR